MPLLHAPDASKTAIVVSGVRRVLGIWIAPFQPRRNVLIEESLVGRARAAAVGGTTGPRPAANGETGLTDLAVLAGVAHHVIETPGVRQLASHRAGARAFGVAPMPEVSVVEFVAPVERGVRAGLAGVDPLGLGRQVHTGPAGVLQSILVAEVYDRVVVPLRKTRVLPGPLVAGLLGVGNVAGRLDEPAKLADRHLRPPEPETLGTR